MSNHTNTPEDQRGGAHREADGLTGGECVWIAAMPTEYGTSLKNQLFDHAYEKYTGSTDTRREKLIDDVETFALEAFDREQQAKSHDEYEMFVEDPAVLGTLATLSAVCVMETEQFEEARPQHVQPWVDIRELYTSTMVELLSEHAGKPLLQDLAEMLYRKPYGTVAPAYPGRVVTDIVHRPDVDGGLYLEIPLVAASPETVVYEDPEQQEELRTWLEDNRVYVPLEVLTPRYREYLTERGFADLYETKRELLSDEQLTWLADQESKLSEEFRRYDRTNRTERLWTSSHRGRSVVTVLERAIRAMPDTVVRVGEPATAGQLATIIKEYDPESDWEESVCRRIQTGNSLATALSKHEEHPRIEIERDTAEDQNLYAIRPSHGDSKDLSVSHPEDLLELPCYQNLDERLQEKGPVRKELYDMVRKIAWLPEYRTSGGGEYDDSVQGRPDEEKIVEDIKEFFSRWPWYDPHITEYQTRYELEQDEKRRRDPDQIEPLPMGCNNPTMQRYCIGKDACPYSIYGSLPFSEVMYDRLDQLQSLEDGGDGD